MLKFLGESKEVNGRILTVEILENQSIKESIENINCLEVVFETDDTASYWKQKRFEIIINEDDLLNTQSIDVKKAYFINCTFVELIKKGYRKAKISKINLGEGIEKYTVLVYEDAFKRWITCGTIDENGIERIIVFDAEYEAESFIESTGNLYLEDN